MGIKLRRAQALMELAAGLFALALVVSAMTGFALYFVKSLRAQNALRVKSPQATERIDVSPFAARYIFGNATLTIREKVDMPSTTISNQGGLPDAH